MIMPKEARFAGHEELEMHQAEDPDELQLMDESDFHWVEMWKNALRYTLN